MYVGKSTVTVRPHLYPDLRYPVPLPSILQDLVPYVDIIGRNMLYNPTAHYTLLPYDYLAMPSSFALYPQKRVRSHACTHIPHTSILQNLLEIYKEVRIISI